MKQELSFIGALEIFPITLSESQPVTALEFFVLAEFSRGLAVEIEH